MVVFVSGVSKLMKMEGFGGAQTRATMTQDQAIHHQPA